MNESKIDIIIPVFNRAHLIMDTLNSIRNQSFNEWICYVVDDGSEDHIEEVVSGLMLIDSRFKFYKRPIDRIKGANSCRNYGFELSSSAYVYWLDSDDLLRADALETYFNAFNTSTDVVIAPVEKVDLATGEVLGQNKIQSDDLIFDFFNYKVSYYVSGPMWKRSFLIHQEELFDESLGHHDDWDFNLRMIYKNPTKVHLQNPLCIYRQHSQSFKNEIFKGNNIELESAFLARFKHLKILSEFDSANKKKYQKCIAHQYKKATRNILLFSPKNEWYKYYFKGIALYIATSAYGSAFKFTFGVALFTIFKKGYRFFD